MSLVHAFWPENYAVIAGSIEIYPENVNRDGFSFFVPVGVNSYDGPTGAVLPVQVRRARHPGVQRQHRRPHRQRLTQVTVTLNRGETYSTRGFINGAPSTAITINRGRRSSRAARSRSSW